MQTATNSSDLKAISIARFASALSIGLSSAKNIVASGEITSFRVGRRVLIPVEALDEYIKRRLKGRNAA